MATFKTEVHLHRKKKDGTYNIKIRITHKQKKKYLSTPFFVSEKEVTRTGKIKNQHYLDACEDEIRRYRKICDSVGF
ncbi:MAG: transposase, partial [Prevotellaceae bacterium]|nr:transposase [Prevotellaceae bacterium]